MMTLTELKQPYDNLLKGNKFDLNNKTPKELVDLYNLNTSSDLYISALICKSWPVLQQLYYKNNNGLLSTEECYDIFIQTLYYVLEKQVWEDENSSLYNDEDAFIKAMTITSQCRKKNYLHAQHRQKRIANYNSLSLDGISEECSEGYFTPYEEDFDECDSNRLISKLIKYFFNRKEYVTAFTLEGIINFNLYSSDNEFDIKKLRKYLRHLSDKYCIIFSNKYKLNLDEVLYSRKYFSELPQDKLDISIENSFTKLRHSEVIKQMVEVC